MFALYALTNAGFFGPNPVGQTSTDTNPLLVPAGAAFAIWGPIYLGLAVFPIFQLIKNRSDHPDWVQFRTTFAVNVILNGLWLVFASYDWMWLTVLTIAVMLVTLFRLNQLLIRIAMEGGEVNFWAERLVFSLYFAWITLATVLNVTTALDFYDWDGFGIPEVTWTLIIGGVAIAITSYTALKFRDFVYPMVVIWAFVWLGVRHWESIDAIVGLAGVGIAAAFGAMVLVRPTSGARTRVQEGVREGDSTVVR